MRTFIVIWFGQLLSIIGSGLTAFALSIWIYQKTGSTTQFAINTLFATLPAVMLAPITGVWLDRVNKVLAMVLCDAFSAIVTLSIAVLLYNEKLTTEWIYFATFVSSLSQSIQLPAFASITSLLVPTHQLTRASGLSQLNLSISQLISPFLSGVLIKLIGIPSIMMIDVGSFLLATFFTTFSFMRIRESLNLQKKTNSSIANENLKKEPFYQSFKFGFNYLKERTGLLYLLAFFAVTNFLLGMVEILFTPMTLSFAEPKDVGIISSCGGIGMLLGSLLISFWRRGPKKKVLVIIYGTAIQGVVLLAGGLKPSVLLYTICAMIFLMVTPFIMAASQSIWLSRVHFDVQGRVFSFRSMIALSALPLAAALAGPLADNVFEPAMQPRGLLSGFLGSFLGTGKGRGIGLLFIVLGILTIAISIWGYFNKKLINVEDELEAVNELKGS